VVTIDCGGAVIASWTVKESIYGHVGSNLAMLSRKPVFLKKRRNMNDERCNAFGQTHGQTVSSTHNLRTRRMRSSNFTAMEVRERREKSRGHGHKRPRMLGTRLARETLALQHAAYERGR
jgi:hypothetical protein